MTQTNETQPRFPIMMRILHWLMAAMVLSMLFIGVAMVSSLSNYHWLISIHRPLGILILIVVIIRYVNRRLSALPPFPPTMSEGERRLAGVYERVLYSLMFLQPLVGWAMLSAGHYPIVMCGSLHLPPILPARPMLFAVLRTTHSVFAYALFATFLVHLTLVLYHTLVVQDRLLSRMTLWRRGSSAEMRDSPDNHLLPGE
jgi:cytochrome b561